MPSISADNVQLAILKFVAGQFISCFLNDLTLARLVTRDSEPALAQIGDAFNLPAGPMHEGRASFYSQVELTKHIETTFFIPDLSFACTDTASLRKYFLPPSLALASTIDRDLLSLALQFTANKPVGAPGVRLTEGTIDAAETALFCARVPCSAPKYLFVGWEEYSDLRQMRHFRILPTGQGSLMNFSVVRSHLVMPDDTGRTVGLGFAQDAIGLVTRRPVFEEGVTSCYADYDGLSLCFSIRPRDGLRSAQFAVSLLYGYGVIRSQSAVQVLS
jgi:hypothetical protein